MNYIPEYELIYFDETVGQFRKFADVCCNTQKELKDIVNYIEDVWAPANRGTRKLGKQQRFIDHIMFGNVEICQIRNTTSKRHRFQWSAMCNQ